MVWRVGSAHANFLTGSVCMGRVAVLVGNRERAATQRGAGSKTTRWLEAGRQYDRGVHQPKTLRCMRAVNDPVWENLK